MLKRIPVPIRIILIFIILIILNSTPEEIYIPARIISIFIIPILSILFMSIVITRLLFFRLTVDQLNARILPAFISAFISWFTFTGFSAFLTFSFYYIERAYDHTIIFPTQAQGNAVFIGLWSRLFLPPHMTQKCLFVANDICLMINRMVWNNWIGYVLLLSLGIITFFVTPKTFRWLEIKPTQPPNN